MRLDARCQTMDLLRNDCGISMPFYLVTQTTLIEADDPQSAAQNAIDLIRSGSEVLVAVKRDHTDISHVVVGAKTLPSIVSEETTVGELPAEHVSEVMSQPGKLTWMHKLADAISLRSWRR